MTDQTDATQAVVEDAAPEAEAVTPDVTAETAGEVTEPTEAQSVDQLPDWAQKLIKDARGEAAKQRAAKKEAAEKAEKERLAEEGKWKELYEKAQNEASQAKLEAMRLQVATDKKLPPVLASRLTGSTIEELEADADELLKAIPAPQTFSSTDSTNGTKKAQPTSKTIAAAVVAEQAAVLGVDYRALVTVKKNEGYTIID